MDKNTYYTGKIADIVAAYKAAKSAGTSVSSFIGNERGNPSDLALGGIATRAIDRRHEDMVQYAQQEAAEGTPQGENSLKNAAPNDTRFRPQGLERQASSECQSLVGQPTCKPTGFSRGYLTNLTFTDTMDGLNVRSVYGDAQKMGRLMEEFTGKFKKELATPYIDTEFNALVATNGVSMILCDIPKGMTKDDAVLAGFVWNIGCDLRWWSVIRDREVTDYNLSNLKKVAVIKKGDALHNLLMGLAECAKAYEHEDKGGCFHTIYCWFGNKLYNVRAVADMVTGVFKMGNTEIRLCEQVGYAGWYSNAYTPMHVVGIDGKNNSRGLVMPVRHYGMTDGAFVFPTEDKAVNAA